MQALAPHTRRRVQTNNCFHPEIKTGPIPLGLRGVFVFSITGVYLSQRQQWPPRRRVLQRIHPPFVTVSQPPRRAFFRPAVSSGEIPG